MHSDEELVPIAQAARHLRVSKRWLQQQADAGVIPALRADKRLLVSLPAVSASLSRIAERSFSKRPASVATATAQVVDLTSHTKGKRHVPAR